MTKVHTSIKNIRNGWRKTFRVGYCDLQNIMRGQDPQYYNAGVYGWNCDIYCDYKRDIAISTGYRNMTGERIPSEILKKYDDRAKKILEGMWVKPYEEYMKELEENRENFLDELNNL